jgi:hypothetical protein
MFLPHKGFLGGAEPARRALVRVRGKATYSHAEGRLESSTRQIAVYRDLTVRDDWRGIESIALLGRRLRLSRADITSERLQLLTRDPESLAIRFSHPVLRQLVGRRAPRANHGTGNFNALHLGAAEDRKQCGVNPGEITHATLPLVPWRVGGKRTTSRRNEVDHQFASTAT